MTEYYLQPPALPVPKRDLIFGDGDIKRSQLNKSIKL